MNADNMCHFCTNLVETAKHCLWSCDSVMETWKRIVTLLIPVYPERCIHGGGIMGGGIS